MAAIPTAEQVAAFQRDGAVFLPGFLAPELVEQLAEGVEREIAEPGPLAIKMAPADGSGEFVEDFCRWATSPSTAPWSRRAAWAAPPPS